MCVGFVMCECVCVCGFCNVLVCESVGVCMCGFRNVFVYLRVWVL